MSACDRMEKFGKVYGELQKKVTDLTKEPGFSELIRSFDSLFPQYAECFSDVKKLDFFLWQDR